MGQMADLVRDHVARGTYICRTIVAFAGSLVYGDDEPCLTDLQPGRLPVVRIPSNYLSRHFDGYGNGRAYLNFYWTS